MTDARGWIAALRGSHDHLVGIVGALSDPKIAGPSYCDEWSVAQVLSHLGSGAEIGLLNLEATLAGAAAPDRERYVEIWDRWNAKSPADMAADALVYDERHIARLEGLSDEQLAGLSTEFLGRTLDATGIVGMRLAEHAVHTWDVEVTTDPAARIQPEATALVVGLLPARAARLARGDKPSAAPVDLVVATEDPATAYLLHIGAEDVSLVAGPAGLARGRATLPAEALIRLIYGRLDPEHTPAAVSVTGPVSLDELRSLFPGF